jgi:hypothetical protein
LRISASRTISACTEPAGRVLVNGKRLDMAPEAILYPSRQSGR